MGTVCSYQNSKNVVTMLKWAYNPYLRSTSISDSVNVSGIEIELNDVKEDPNTRSKYHTERKSPKKKVHSRALTVSYATTRRSSFSIVKQGLKAIKIKKNLSNSNLAMNEADDDEVAEDEDEKIMEKPEKEPEEATDIAKCHFSRVFEPDSGGAWEYEVLWSGEGVPVHLVNNSWALLGERT